MRTSQWLFDKTEAVASNGMVSSKHPLASQAGIEILRQGGNAVDAAVATAFAVGVVEPWMNGLGGGGFMICYFAKTAGTVAIDFNMAAPEAASPDMYTLEDGIVEGAFPWHKTKNNESVYGYKAIGIPGTVAGLSLALRKFGTRDLATVLEPAIRYAEEGFALDWFGMLQITFDTDTIAKFPETAATFFKNGFPRKSAVDPTKVELIRQPALAVTLRRIARDGPDEFYRGETAHKMAVDIQADGGFVSENDLDCYRPIVSKPALQTTYRACQNATAADSSGGPTLIEALNLFYGLDFGVCGRGSTRSLHLIAEASRIAFADRYNSMGHGESQVPWRDLVEPNRLAQLRALIKPDRAAPDLQTIALKPAGSTTHLSVIDRDRNMVSLTQTLVSPFGSRVTIPGTGVLLNNAMFWFDPEPGKANSVIGGMRPLANMTPILILKNDQPWVTVGASGGRRIIGSMIQVATDLVDYGISIQQAISAPRIDVSTGRLIADDRFPKETLAGLKAMGHNVLAVTESISPRSFSGPCGVMIDSETGTLRSGVDPFHPATAIGC